MTKVPWIVALFKVTLGPGAAGNREQLSAHIFSDLQSFRQAIENCKVRGRWGVMVNGVTDEFGESQDSVFWYGDQHVVGVDSPVTLLPSDLAPTAETY